MKIQDIIDLSASISHPEIKSKHFTISSLTDLAYLKRKLKKTIEEHVEVQTDVAKEKALIIPAGGGAVQYVKKGDDDESKAHFEEFMSFYDEHQAKEYEVGKLNFISKEEIEKACAEVSADTAIILITFLMKDGQVKEVKSDLSGEIRFSPSKKGRKVNGVGSTELIAN